MRTWLSIVAIVLLAACGGGASESADEGEPTTGSETTDPDTSVSSPADPGRPVEPGADGPPENCPFRVADRCYDTSEAACAAAGCAADRCQILESYPAQVRCE